MAEAATIATAETVVDLAFGVAGRRIPEDHGYLLYGALCRACPEIHGARWLGVHPLRGQRLLDGTVRLPPRAQLLLRLPAARIPAVLPLSGKTLDVGPERLQIGVPQVRALQPAASLDARMVAIKLTDTPRKEGGTLDKDAMKVGFLRELVRQMEKLGVQAEVELCGRQQVTVGGKRVIGWSVRLSGLSEENSLLVQAQGLGGKRAMGCGVFVGTRGRG